MTQAKVLRMNCGLTVEEFLERRRVGELTIERSVALWLKLDQRLHPEPREGAVKPVKPVLKPEVESRARKTAATRLRQAQEKLDAELEGRGLAPDGKPYSDQPPQSFLQRSPRGHQ